MVGFRVLCVGLVGVEREEEEEGGAGREIDELVEKVA